MTEAESATKQRLEQALAQARVERDRLYALITPVLLKIVNKNLTTSPDASLVRQYKDASAAFERAKSDLEAFQQAKINRNRI